MLDYIQLESEKFMKSAERQNKKAFRRYRNQKAIRDFVTFLFGLGAIWLGLFAIQHMSIWRPHVENLLASIGIG